MGILAEPQQFIRALNLPRGFAVCELGDQYITENPGENYPASRFYKGLGCGKYVAIDGNGRGTITADLNLPLSNVGLTRAFDLVTNFGTGEHVFNQAQVWITIHELTKLGGFIAFDRPIAGYVGHCFYTIQWCLLTALAHVNGYKVIRMEMRETTRGQLARGVFQRPEVKRPFVIPQQGRYYNDLHPIMSDVQKRVGPDHKNKTLRADGFVGGRAQPPPWKEPEHG